MAQRTVTRRAGPSARVPTTSARTTTGFAIPPSLPLSHTYLPNLPARQQLPMPTPTPTASAPNA
ncbi:hypothetical protein Kpho01_51820 [Kitasatospora phosalacinea]|uniref:Uncharacterized protein n=1 Tax=Kitasatospora phosalacinea TaxID=2065 RepID=A0A9W6PLC6_9ACTN|nr:hypothetical protein Kpho01_51820 [Kitasatospora phosalacinea]